MARHLQMTHWATADDLERAMQRRFFSLMLSFAVLSTSAFAFTFAWQRQWTPAVVNATITLVSLACARWAWTTGRTDWPMRTVSTVMIALLGWQTLQQGAELPAAGWWLSVVPFILAGAGLHRMAVGAVVVFIAIVTVLFFGPGVDAFGLALGNDVGPTRRYVAVVGSEFLALALILTAMHRRRAAAQAIELARATAVNAVAAKARFLAHMSHEIRTPLNGVIGTAELLRSSRLEETQRAQLLALQEKSARTLLALVNDVLDWTKLEAGKVTLEARSLDLRGLVFETNELFALQAYNKGIELTSSCNPDVPRNFIGDATRLRQILDNLVGNAVKFTSQGGVHIHLSVDAGDAAKSARRGSSPSVRVEVADSGLGIDPERLKSLFKAFSQADHSITRRYGGTGLGLAISLELARLMGGRIDVTSELGRGSTFALVVPLEAAQRTRAITPAKPRSDVLLASASPGVQRHLTTILHDLGIEPLVVRELPLPVPAPGCRLLLVDAPLLASLADPRAWMERQAEAGKRVVVITPLGSDMAVGAPKDAVLLYKPVRRRSLKAVLDALEHKPCASQAPLTPARPACTAGPRVLLVEDNAVNQIVVQAMLTELGASSVVASNGHKALQCLAAEAFDLVLMDMQMPEMDGLTATHQWRMVEAARCSSRIPVVAMTANSPAEALAACRSAGMDGFLAKPFGMSELRAALANRAPVAGRVRRA